MHNLAAIVRVSALCWEGGTFGQNGIGCGMEAMLEAHASRKTEKTMKAVKTPPMSAKEKPMLLDYKSGAAHQI